MLTALREQVQSILYEIPAKRKPALRRSDLADALFATDLPLVAERSAVETFCARIGQLGFRVWLYNGWLVLDGPVPVPQTHLPSALAGECGCCISLLLRHPDAEPADAYIREVVKAADAGRQPFERLCASMHRTFAERLRKHERLPGGLIPYLCYAYHEQIKEEDRS